MPLPYTLIDDCVNLPNIESFTVKYCKVSEQTVCQLIALFNQTGSVRWSSRRNNLERLMGEFERLMLIFVHPDIFQAKVNANGNS